MWTSKNRNHQRWDGTLQADSFEGDGSKLSNLPAGTETDPFFQAASGAYNTHIALVEEHIDWTNASYAFSTSSTIHSDGNITTGGTVDGIDIAGQAAFVTAAYNHITADGSSHSDVAANTADIGNVSGAYIAHAADSTIHYVDPGFLTEEEDPIWNAQSGAYVLDTQYQITSGAYVAHAADTSIHQEPEVFSVSGALLDGSIFSVSGALLDGSLYSVSGALLDGSIFSVSGALLDGSVYSVSGALLDASAFATSGAATVSLGAHVSDSTDPHGVNLTQTSIASSGTISGAHIRVTGDEATASSAYVANILFGLGATPPAAGGFTQGSIYVQYTN